MGTSFCFMYYVGKLGETLTFTLMDANYDISHFVSLDNVFFKRDQMNNE